MNLAGAGLPFIHFPYPPFLAICDLFFFWYGVLHVFFRLSLIFAFVSSEGFFPFIHLPNPFSFATFESFLSHIARA